MKVDGPLTLIKGLAASTSSPPPAGGPFSSPGQEGGIVLISRENRRARQLDRSTLADAKRLLAEVRGSLASGGEDTLAAIHHLSPQRLVRLK